MKDQYNNEVPSDLVLLDSSWIGDFLKDTELWAINKLDWFKPSSLTKLIFVSASQLENCIEGLVDFTGPEDCGLEKAEWLKIDQVLHRWDVNDGFYHA